MKKYLTSIILSLFFSIYVSAIIPEPVSYWNFNETSGSTATDVKASNDGTNSAGITINQPGKLGVSYHFDGTNNSKVTLPDNSNTQHYTSSFTWRAWVYPTSYVNSKNAIVGGEEGAFTFFITNTGYLGMGKVNTYDATTSSLSVPLNQWSYVAITFNSSATTNNVVYYCNGSSQTITFNYDYNSGAATNLIGQRYASSDKFIGRIDEVSLWDQVLSGAEIAEDYNLGSGKTYPFSVVVSYSSQRKRVTWFNYFPVADEEPIPQNNFTGDVIYVDPVSGSDVNDGTTIALAVKTLTRAEALITSSTEYLALSDTIHSGNLTMSSIVRTSGDPLTITTWHKYGSGNAKIDGRKTLGTFTQSGNYWKIVDTDLPVGATTAYVNDINRSDYEYFITYMNGIYIDNQFYKISKYPFEKRYLKAEAKASDWSYLDDTDSTRTYGYWTGATLVTESPTWICAKMRVSNYNGSRYTLTDVNDEETLITDNGSTGHRYFLINHRNATKRNGQWYSKQENDSLVVYYTSNLNTHTVKVPIKDYLINLTSCQYITISDVDFIGSNQMHIKAFNNTGIVIDQCNFYDAPYAAVYAKTNAGLTITNNNVYRSGANGFICKSGSDLTVNNNYLEQIGTDETFGGDKVSGSLGVGIFANTVYGTVDIKYNCMDSLAYAGIVTSDLIPTGDGRINIYRNWINQSMMTLSDGAAIYMHRNATDFTKYIRGNLITNTYGNREFNRNNQIMLSIGIYLDTNDDPGGDNRNWVIDSNYVYKTPSSTFTSSNAYPNYWRDNNFIAHTNTDHENYDMKLREIGSGIYSTEHVRNNIVLGDSACWGMYWTWTGSYVNNGNTVDYNDYYNPFRNVDNTIWIDLTSTTQTPRNLTYIRANSTYEDHGTYNKTNWLYSDVSGITQDQFIWMFANWSATPHTFNLGSAIFQDLEGNSVSGTIQLNPYKAIVLFYVSGSLSGVDDPIYND